MIPDWLQAMLSWLTAHPQWAGFVVFSIAMLESLLVVGVVVPGAIAMFGFGALIAIGVLDPWSTYLWAVAGAICGDGISFWIGYRFKDRLRVMWPLKNHPQMLAKGEDFFRQHGGKSVVLGRFVGPIRAVIPTVAGIAGMSPMRFAVVNVLSALAWAPAYLLPGFVVGVSLLSLASQIAWRITVILLALLGGVLIVFWLARRIYRALAPLSEDILARIVVWSQNFPRYGWIIDSLLDSRRPDTPALSRLGLAIAACLWALIGFSALNLGRADHAGWDSAIYNLLQNIRFPSLDSFMIGVNALGTPVVAGAVAIAVAIYFSMIQNWVALRHWLAVAVFAGFAQMSLFVFTGSDFAMDANGNPTPVSGPSGHVIAVAAIYGLLTIMLGRSVTSLRWTGYAVATTLIIGVGFAQIYLGAHWFSSVVIAWGIGLIWAILVGIAYRRHRQDSVGSAGVLSIVAITVAISLTWQISSSHDSQQKRFRPPLAAETITQSQWRDGLWETLPARRLDIQNYPAEPLQIQFAGMLSEFETVLSANGWQRAAPFSIGSFVTTLKPDAAISDVPILPRVHSHKDSKAIWFKTENDSQWVLYIWSTHFVLGPSENLFLGTIEKQRANTLGYFTIRQSTTTGDAAVDYFKTQVHGLTARVVERPRTDVTNDAWRGTTLLLWRNP